MVLGHELSEIQIIWGSRNASFAISGLVIITSFKAALFM